MIRAGKSREPRPLQVKSRPPAAGSCRAGESGARRSSSAVVGVADVELHRLADADDSPTWIAPVAVGPEDVADEEVAAAERLPVFADDPPDVQPLRGPLLVVGGSALKSSCRTASAGVGRARGWRSPRPS